MPEEIANADLLAYWLQLTPDEVMMEMRSDMLGFINVVRRCAELLSQETAARGQGPDAEPLSSALMNDLVIAFLDKSNELQDELDMLAAYVSTRRSRDTILPTSNGHV